VGVRAQGVQVQRLGYITGVEQAVQRQYSSAAVQYSRVDWLGPVSAQVLTDSHCISHPVRVCDPMHLVFTLSPLCLTVWLCPPPPFVPPAATTPWPPSLESP
jgi:hypothetical protein